MSSYVERNIADCETKIESLDVRIRKVKETGEDVKELKEWRTGYLKKLDELLDQ